MADVVVCENIVGAPMDALEAEFDVLFDPDLWKDPARLAREVAGARALVVRNQTQVTAELIRAAGRLEIIGRAGAGVNNIDVDAATLAGMVVAYTPGENSLSVAELTLGLMLSLARRISAADRHTRAGGWARHQFTGTELAGKTLGVVGLGRIGTLTAERAKTFGMSIRVFDLYLEPHVPVLTQLEAERTSLEDLLGQSDFITCHVPLSEQTDGMFGYDAFRRMKPTAFFVNTSRGEVVVEDDLIRALEEKRLAGAALDVRGTEPPPAGPLAEMENVILTPHIAAFTQEAQHRVVEAVCRDVTAVLEGGPAQSYLNFPTPTRGPNPE